jgi:hypothetical protein
MVSDDVIVALINRVPNQVYIIGFAVSACLRYRTRFGRAFTWERPWYSFFFTIVLSLGGGFVWSNFLVRDQVALKREGSNAIVGNYARFAGQQFSIHDSRGLLAFV